MQRRSFSWVVTLVGIGLAGVVAVSGATAHDARSVASAFELTVQGRDTLEWEGDVITLTDLQWTFRSQAPFCASGTFREYGGPGWSEWRLACDDGTGGLTFSIARPWDHKTSSWNTAWRILDGSGSYVGLRGQGSMRIEVLSSEDSAGRSVMTWRSTLRGDVDRDAVAPTLSFSGATATKLSRPAGSYALRLKLALHDNLAENPVSYTLRVYTRRLSAGGHELADRFGTARSEPVSMTLRIRPPAGARTVRLVLSGSDPVGNEASITRSLKLPQ